MFKKIAAFAFVAASTIAISGAAYATPCGGYTYYGW